jgi:hypothetical protein
VRPSSFDGMSFETAIEAAASVLNCLRRDRRPVELLTSTGAVLTGSNPDAPHAVLEQLATIEPDGPDRLVDVLAGLRSKRAGLVVAIVGRLDDATARALAHLAAHVAVIAVVVNSDSGSDSNSGSGAGAAPRRPSASFLVVDATDSPFPEAWNQAIRRWTSVAASSRLQRSRR